MDGSRTILCIEDDNFITELYVRSLRKAGFVVDAVISGQDGLKLALEKDYDFILLDIMIPDITGIEILKQVRGGSEDLLPHTNIIITTNLDQDESTRAQLEQLADGYLIKAEITPSRLVELIGNMPPR